MGIESQLVGTWELVRYQRFRNGVFDRDTMGAGPSGRIIWAESGYMSAFLLSSPWARGEQIEQNWKTFLSYSGRWRLLSANTIAHDVDMASVVEFIGTRFVRSFKWTPEGMLSLSTEPHLNRYKETVYDELLWRPADKPALG